MLSPGCEGAEQEEHQQTDDWIEKDWEYPRRLADLINLISVVHRLFTRRRKSVPLTSESASLAMERVDF
jgi:hypothetical protein